MCNFKNSLVFFLREEEGAQVVEYALIIAVVSIALILALSNPGLGAQFSAFVDRVGDCLVNGTC